jgi:tRNA(Arg) A34 adenosine deaminase TadA
VYGAVEPKTGALVSTVQALEIAGVNHRFTVSGGVREDAARELIQQFFRGKRRL